MAEYRHFDVEQVDNVVVARLRDPKLFDALIVTELQDDLIEYVEKSRPRNMLVNFAKVSYCSTAVINGLLRAKKRLVAEGGRFKLCSMNAPIREAYRMLNLDGTVFQIFDDEEEALASFTDVSQP